VWRAVPRPRPLLVVPLALLAVAAGLGAWLGTLQSPTEGPGHQVIIQRTEGGVPHITARDAEGLGYGYGYAFAQDDLCVFADDVVTLEAARSRFFGPAARYTVGGNGMTFTNLGSDLFYQQVNDSKVVERLVSQPPPLGPTRQVLQAVQGWAEGYDHYLETTGVDHLPDPSCRGKPWVRPIRPLDLYRRFYQLNLIAGQGALIDAIASASPPSSTAPSRATGTPGQVASLSALSSPGTSAQLGSNAVALGSAGTDDHQGMLLANPHFPWKGTERFYQVQLTIPGQLDVAGASIMGSPAVNIGHTQGLAWSHTVSTAFRFTPYRLTLVPGDPTAYLFGGRAVPMSHRTVSVTVRRPGGRLARVTHTFWYSRFGPLLVYPRAGWSWTTSTAYAVQDANADNMRDLNEYFAIDRAQSVAQLVQAESTYQGLPWVNTIAADSAGHAYYADASVVPHVTDAQVAACVDTPADRLVLSAAGLPVLDGSQPACDWGSDPDAVVPGIFGPSQLPHLQRDDFVENSNDSPWLTNPAQPLTGYPRIVGDVGTARSPRTRLALTMVTQRLAGTDGQPGRGFSLDQLQAMEMNMRNESAELFLGSLVGLCRSHPQATASDGRQVDLRPACSALAGWDGRAQTTARGEVVFRQFVEDLQGLPSRGFAVPFDPSRPVTTPNTLDTSDPAVLRALADAVELLQRHRVPVDVQLGQAQFSPNGHLPIPGCNDTEGCFNVVTQPALYAGVSDGSSFIEVVQFGPHGPLARQILTYSLSSDPTSPHYSDQTALYSSGRWLDERWTPAQVAASPDLQTTTLSGP